MAQQTFTRQTMPQKGLWTAASGDAIGPEYSPWCQNVRFRYGKVLRAPGRSVTLDTAPNHILDFAIQTNINGVKSIMRLTASDESDSQIAQFDASTNTFFDLGTLHIGSRLPVRFSWTQGEDRLLIVRASEVSSVWSTPNTMALPPSPFPPITPQNAYSIARLNTPAAVFIEYFKGHVVVGNIVFDPGIVTPSYVGPIANRLQWSREGVYYEWRVGILDDGKVGGGFLDLFDGSAEEITGMKVLNDRLVVYRNSSITDINATGDADNPFLPENRVFGIGCLMPWSLASAGQFHIFVGNDFNIYAWDGSNLDPIGSPIHSYLRQLFDPGKAFSSTAMVPFATMFRGFKEYWLVVPQEAGAVVLIYDYFRSSWTRDYFPGHVTALMETIIPGAMGTPGFNPVGHPANYPTMLVGALNDFYQIDERVVGDWQERPADGGMDMFVDTPDMYYAQNSMLNGTLERVMVSEDIPRPVGEPPYQIKVSIDRGNSFPYTSTIQPKGTHWGFEFADLNISANVRRYRFYYPKENGAAVPTLRAYTDVYVPSGEFFPVDRPINPPDPDIPPANIN